ncbi:MAG: DUF4910 domain-containing protein [Burkholderiales bacterium]|nr:DUF4910 domain-containing protein [Burkholderiales bacterium]
MQMTDVIEKLLMKNRTIVSRDDAECMSLLSRHFPLHVHKYATGNEYQTWPIPPEWNVRKAVLSDKNGIIGSYDESPLFLAPYSMPFSGQVTRDELVKHVFSNPAVPDAYCYEFRLAYNFQRRLKEWRISLPHERLENLPEGPFNVEIDVEVSPGHMLIGEMAHPGRSGNWFSLLAHYCHVAQANDGIAGVAVMLEAMKRIQKKHPDPLHGYKALLMPETIGSSVYAATHEEEIDKTLGAVFSEMAGAESPLQLVYSRRGDTYIDRVFLHVLSNKGKLPCRCIPFRRGWGNDELVFDAPGVGVPVVSMDRYPFAAYHTHHDNMSLVKPARLEEVVDIITSVVDVLEEDYIPRPRHRVPTYLTRFNLYADWTCERAQYDVNTRLIDSMWSGLSVLDIALSNELDPTRVSEYIGGFVREGLVEASPVTAEYTRKTRFLSKVFQNG